MARHAFIGQRLLNTDVADGKSCSFFGKKTRKGPLESSLLCVTLVSSHTLSRDIPECANILTAVCLCSLHSSYIYRYRKACVHARPSLASHKYTSERL